VSYRLNSPSVIHETIDDEVVIINLDKGHYYSLDGCGARIWRGLVGGAPAAAIAAALEGDGTEIDAGIQALAAELESEGLIVATAADPLAAPLDGEPPIAYEPVELQRYSDMEELLLLDPIHEVDQQGWPHPDPAA
jgi:Coenzyme PQQ synthesis protein D (PqqD)